jgi:Transposase IS116/IS110/IS902 family
VAQLLRADLLPEARGRPAAGAPAARPAAPPGQPGPPRHLAAQPDPRGGRGPRLRPARELLDGPGRGWLAELDLPPVSREIVTGCLASIDALAPVIERLDGELHQHAKAGPRVKVLRTLPGVGEFTALVMLAEIGDITRFGSARKLASWAGLTPAVRGSDLTVRHGHIWKAGLGVAALGPEPGRADRQAVPGVRRQLPGHRQAPGKRSPPSRSPASSSPAPVTCSPARSPGHPARRRTPARQPDHQDALADQEGHQAPGTLAPAA